ncbi:MAG: hypothetical protein ABJB03_01160 [Rhodoglobus sp.]
MIFLVVWALLCLALIASRSMTLLVALTVVAGVLQGPILSLTHDTQFQLVDDIPAVSLIIAAVIRGAFARSFRAPRTVLVFIAIVALCAVAVARSPSLSVGVTQARQVIVPIGLAVAGYVLHEALNWRVIFRLCLVLGAGVAAWMLAEQILQAPLMDPVWYYLNAAGGAPITMRDGLPPSYFADGITGGVVFRPGGPFFNPPTAGFFLGLVAFTVMRTTSGVARMVGLAIVFLALGAAYARAGMVIAVCAVVLYWIWYRMGRMSAVLVGIATAVYVAQIFVEQGNSASHSDGLINGTLAGLSSVIGVGFGTSGYAAKLEGATDSGVGESLLGLYFAWLGIPLILLAIAYCIALGRRMISWPRKESLLSWVCFGMVAAIAVSETGSSLAATSVLWMLLGLALRQPLIPRALRHSDVAAEREGSVVVTGPTQTGRRRWIRDERRWS